MKKLLLTTAAITALSTTATAVDLGVIGLDGTFAFSTGNTTEEQTGETTDTYKTMKRKMFLKPRLSLEVSERMALVPYVGIGFDTERTKNEEEGVKFESDNIQMIFGGGFGLDYTLIEKGWFALSSGPRANFKMYTSGNNRDPKEYANLGFGVDLPLYLNFSLNDSFGFRLTSQIVDISMWVYKNQETTDSELTKTTSPSFTILGSDFDGFKDVPFELGFYFQF